MEQNYAATLFKILTVIPLIFILSIYEFLSSPNELNIAYSLWQCFFGKLSGNFISTFVVASESVSFIILFLILFGTYLSKYYDIGSVYIFSRVKSRCSFFAKKLIALFIITCFYVLCYLATNLLLCLKKSTLSPDINVLYVFIFMFCYLSFLLMIFVLISNIIALYINSTNGIFLTTLFVFLLIFFCTYFKPGKLSDINPFYLSSTGISLQYLIKKLLINIFYLFLLIILNIFYFTHHDIYYTDMQ